LIDFVLWQYLVEFPRSIMATIGYLSN